MVLNKSTNEISFTLTAYFNHSGVNPWDASGGMVNCDISKFKTLKIDNVSNARYQTYSLDGGSSISFGSETTVDITNNNTLTIGFAVSNYGQASVRVTLTP